MLEKNKKYTYEEIKKAFDSIKTEVIMNPFGDEKEKDNGLNKETQFTTMLMAMPVIHTLEEKLFGKEKNNE